MTKEVTLLDLFSGIGGFAKGLEDGGFIIKKHFFSEIDKHAIANYKYNFKKSKYVGPIELIDRAALGKVDIIAFGSPCQDFSIAGKREGLDGERSSLILEAIQIIIEKKPTFFIWENVKGTFSSNNGADFWAILQEFANMGYYNIEWQLLNTLWVLPQNRERIYLVGHFTTANRSFEPIFPFTKNDRLFAFKKGSKKRQSQAEYCTTINGKADRANGTYVDVQENAGTLTAGVNSGGLHSDMTVINATYYSKAQQDRVYNMDGAIGCLNKNRGDNKAKIFTARKRENRHEVEFQSNDATNTLTSVQKDNLLCISTHPRTGDPKKGGTGLISKKNESYCLDTQNSLAISNDKGYRRLTEIEFERLQGFPDNWTQFGVYLISKKVIKYLNKKNYLTPTAKEKLMLLAYTKFKTKTLNIAQTNRYKLVGNAVTTIFPKMIAQKLITNYNL